MNSFVLSKKRFEAAFTEEHIHVYHYRKCFVMLKFAVRLNFWISKPRQYYNTEIEYVNNGMNALSAILFFLYFDLLMFLFSKQRLCLNVDLFGMLTMMLPVRAICTSSKSRFLILLLLFFCFILSLCCPFVCLLL